MGIEVTGSAIVTRKGLRRARRGWPWLHKDDVVRYDGDGGPFVDLVDETSLPMGTALYDPNGPATATIRLLSSARTRDPVGLIHARLERALARRETDLDGSDAGRICHGEADGIPGLFVDRFGPGLLISVDCPPMGRVVNDLLPLMVERTTATTVAKALGDEVTLVKGSDARVRFVHGRLELKVDLATPAAQRLTEDLERQRSLRRWSRGRCLDLCAGFCGFGLQLAEAGAREVVLVDEAPALSSFCEDDAKHNDIEAKVERVEAEPLAWLRAESEERQRFDVVVYHPKPVEGDDVETATSRAIEHAALCMKLLDEGSILATSSSSTALDDEAFAGALQDAAAKTRKRLQMLALYGRGPDHPVLAGVRPPPSLIVSRVLATA
jgi:23S rRNA (cytosine1962-C5)-methyltransferase